MIEMESIESAIVARCWGMGNGKENKNIERGYAVSGVYTQEDS